MNETAIHKSDVAVLKSALCWTLDDGPLVDILLLRVAAFIILMKSERKMIENRKITSESILTKTNDIVFQM